MFNFRFLLSLTIILTGTLSAQGIKSSLFGEADKLLEEVNKASAYLYSPENFETAIERAKTACQNADQRKEQGGKKEVQPVY